MQAHTGVYIHTHALQTRTHILSSDSHSTRDITRNIASTNEVWRLSCLAQTLSVLKGKVSEVILKGVTMATQVLWLTGASSKQASRQANIPLPPKSTLTLNYFSTGIPQKKNKDDITRRNLPCG